MKRAILLLLLAGCTSVRDRVPCPSTDGGYVEWSEPVLTGPCDAAFWESWLPMRCELTTEDVGCGTVRTSECELSDGSLTRLTEAPLRLFYEAGECTQTRTR